MLAVTTHETVGNAFTMFLAWYFRARVFIYTIRQRNKQGKNGTYITYTLNAMFL